MCVCLKPPALITQYLCESSIDYGDKYDAQANGDDDYDEENYHLDSNAKPRLGHGGRSLTLLHASLTGHSH